MKNQYLITVLLSAVMVTIQMVPSSLSAADKVVVVPLGGAVGNATAADVVKGKTFSSLAAGKGVTGTLELHPMAQTYTNTNSMTFNLLPADTFTMGSPTGEAGRDDVTVTETQHQVTLSKPIYMLITEVTLKQWFDVMHYNPGHGNNGNESPVVWVNWYEAAYFANALTALESPPRTECYDLSDCSGLFGASYTCNSVVIDVTCTGYRLPSEAEWEYAARAGTDTAYANPQIFDISDTGKATGSDFNSNLAAMGWYSWNSTYGEYPAATKPVAQKQANRWGLYDMHGNVWEWCQDGWNGADYSPDPVIDPTGDGTSSSRVLRGGDWLGNAENARSAFRTRNTPDAHSSYVGFRLVLPPIQ
ncbi:MAG: formylglycine-generating enzyme family protein [Desulfocapsa sp.]|nr:formylglycine-generating enzyme family protein [Desulfocapsa sp.]